MDIWEQQGDVVPQRRGGFFLPSFIVENRGGRTRRVSQNGMKSRKNVVFDLQPEIDTMTTSLWYVDKCY